MKRAHANSNMKKRKQASNAGYGNFADPVRTYHADEWASLVQELLEAEAFEKIHKSQTRKLYKLVLLSTDPANCRSTCSNTWSLSQLLFFLSILLKNTLKKCTNGVRSPEN